ncbi:hypothetical protein PLESTB_000907700 [Pleodorina starrii]|uniref:Uncharacterized protein n=1 Tax=Pleodorina starrii TaxID=330485 RepID=A0A9W6BMH1_9CHLO|nr:hypothetical protein PLESTM_001519300 [Pleodorina starrii]GLC54804.1 hypothetical protein PLESTB_000907700 [Pleodorina starrii]
MDAANNHDATGARSTPARRRTTRGSSALASPPPDAPAAAFVGSGETPSLLRLTTLPQLTSPSPAAPATPATRPYDTHASASPSANAVLAVAEAPLAAAAAVRQVIRRSRKASARRNGGGAAGGRAAASTAVAALAQDEQGNERGGDGSDGGDGRGSGSADGASADGGGSIDGDGRSSGEDPAAAEEGRPRRTSARLRNRNRSAGGAAAVTADAAPAAAAAPPPAVESAGTTNAKRQRRTGAAAAKTGDDGGEATTATATATASKRRKRSSAGGGAAAAATASDSGGSDRDVGAAAAAAAAAADAAVEEDEGAEEEKEEGKKGRAKKPPRRTKAMVSEEIRTAAARGEFAQLVTLHELYPHSRSYGPGPVVLSPTALAVAEAENARLAEATAAAAAAAAQQAALAAAAAAAVNAAAQGLGAGSDGSSGGEGTEPDGDGDVVGAGRGRGRGAGRGRGRSGRAQTKKAAAAAEDPGGDGEGAAEASGGGAVAAAPQPAIVHPMPATVPNLGYACLCATLRDYDIFASRDTTKAGFQSRGLDYVSKLALANARDLRPLIEWNQAHGIRLFRLSSGIFPWMSFYQLEELPDAEAIKEALADAGAAARQYGHRITFHPSEFTKIASDKPEVVETSIKELEVHSRIFDLMGFLPATPYNKINIHVGGVYGDKIASMDRFAKVVLERLSPNCRARLTVENDDRPSMYSVSDLVYLAHKAHIPIVFDFHHHRFCTGGLSEEAAFRLALSTWPTGVRPIVHWSESQEGRRPHAHSDYISGPINLYGMEQEVDVMIESKAKELALLHYREAAVAGRRAVRPETAGGGGAGSGAAATAAECDD